MTDHVYYEKEMKYRLREYIELDDIYQPSDEKQGLKHLMK